jgi:hypothetical protein
MRVSRVRSIAAAAAIAAGTIAFTAPAAHAMPRQTWESECGAAGGRVGTDYYYANGHRYFLSNWCQYTDYYGQVWTDYSNQRYEPYATCPGGHRTASASEDCEAI